MDSSSINRRYVLFGAAAAAATASWQRAAAQAPPVDVNQLTTGSWLDQVKAQHTAIANVLTDLVTNTKAGNAGPLQSDLSQLSYLLTAHSVAEENVLYPMLVLLGLEVNGADLYLQQQFQKVWNTQLDLRTQLGTSDADWLKQLQKLQAAILEHAQVHEEGNYYQKLQSMLTADQSSTLSTLFKTNFLLVKQS
jgi:hemerythrin superfamily protein